MATACGGRGRGGVGRSEGGGVAVRGGGAHGLSGEGVLRRRGGGTRGWRVEAVALEGGRRVAEGVGLAAVGHRGGGTTPAAARRGRRAGRAIFCYVSGAVRCTTGFDSIPIGSRGHSRSNAVTRSGRGRSTSSSNFFFGKNKKQTKLLQILLNFVLVVKNILCFVSKLLLLHLFIL